MSGKCCAAALRCTTTAMIEKRIAIPKRGLFSCGGVRLMLALPEKEEFDHPSSIIYYRVPDMKEAYEVLTSRGVAFEHEPSLVHKTETEELWMAFFRDPDKNVLALMSEVPIES